MVLRKTIRALLEQTLLNEITAYHGTYHDFKKFKDTGSQDFGFHFGNLEQAKQRLSNIPKEMMARGVKNMRHQDGQILEVELDIKNPLRLGEQTSEHSRPGDGSWDHWKVINDIFDVYNPPEWISEKEWEKYEDGTIFDMTYDPDTIKGLIRWLNKKGFDGIVYANQFEGGGDSYIAFHPKQIKIKRKILYSPEKS